MELNRNLSNKIQCLKDALSYERNLIHRLVLMNFISFAEDSLEKSIELSNEMPMIPVVLAVAEYLIACCNRNDIKSFLLYDYFAEMGIKPK